MPNVHFYHRNVHLAIDELNGEILAIRDLVTGDNLIKNTMCCDPETYVYQPFTFKLTDGEKETEYHPLYSREPLDHREKKVEITSQETDEGLLVKVHYHCVTSQSISVGSSTEYVGDKIMLVNPAYETAMDLKRLLQEAGLEHPDAADEYTSYQFYVSDAADKFKRFANSILPYDIETIKQINIEEY